MKYLAQHIILNAIKVLLIAFVIILPVLFILVKNSPKAFAVAGINRTINFQGKLINNPLKTNVSNTSYTVVFTFYDRASGGTVLWQETQTVTTSDGIFRVNLGSVTPIPANFNFNWDGIYLGMKVNADSEMTPRIQMAAVPYAFNAEKVSGLTVQDTSGNSSTSGTLRIANNKIINLGTDNLTFTTGGDTTLTLPSTGTLSTLAGVEVLTNKTIGSTGLAFSGAGTDITTATNEDLTLTPNGSGNLILGADSDSAVTIGTATVKEFPLLVRTGISNNAAFVIDNLNSGNLFSASSSGTTRFTIGTNGEIGLGLSAGLPNFGSANNCLLSGGSGASATWGACVLNPNYWQLNGNVISQGNNTFDVLFGGNSTAAARFAFIGNAGSATPVASISAQNATGQSLYLSSTGSIQTARMATLTLGGNTTGSIQFNPGGLTNPNLFLKNNGDIGVNTINPLASLDVRVNTANSGGTIAIASISGTTSFAGLLVDQRGAGDIFTASTAGVPRFSITNDGGIRLGELEGNSNQCLLSGGAGGAAKWGTCEGIAGADVLYSTAALGNVTLANTATFLNSVTVTPSNSTGDIIVRANLWTRSLSATDQTITVQIRAANVVNCSGSILSSNTASLVSASGANGPAVFTSYLETNPGNTAKEYEICALSTVNSGAAAGGEASAEVIDGGTAPGYASFWNLFDGTGTLSPVNNTVDLLMGGISTSSAKFGILSMNGSASPIASLSATTSSGGSGAGLVFDSGTSSIQSLRRNTLTIGGNTTGALQFNAGGNATLYIKPNGDIGTGTNNINPRASFDIRANTANSGGTIAVASVSGATSFAALVANNSGVGDLFTASKSGATKFTVLNNGNLQFAGTTNFLTTLASAATVNRTLTIPNSGATDTFCLQTAANCGGGGVNLWQQAVGGTLTPGNLTQDLLLGATATASSKIAFINSGSTSIGTPIASISAQTGPNFTALVLNGNGGIQSVRNNTLAIGGSTTGNITLTPSFANGIINVLTGNLKVGSGNPGLALNGEDAFITGTFEVDGASQLDGNLTVNGTSFIAPSATTITLGSTGADSIILGNGGVDTITIGNVASTGVSITDNNWSINSSGVAAFITGTTIGSQTFTTNNIVDSGALTIGTGANGLLSLTPNGSGNLNLSGDFDSQVLIGATSATTEFPLFINSGIGSNATLAINNINSGDLLTASASGTTRFTISNAGAIGISSGYGNLNECLKSGGSASSAVTWGTCGSSGAAGTWTLDSGTGTHYAINTTLNTLFGGTSTASAKVNIAGSITGGKAALIVNQLENQDIFTASASGTPRFALGANGEIKVGSAGNLSSGISGQCLISAGNGAAVAWGGCASGAGAGWLTLQSAQGTLYPVNSTLDFLLGGTSTSAAKFAFIGNAGSANPIASFSATTSSNGNGNGLVFDSSNSTIQSLRRNTLTIGGNTTGSVQFIAGGNSTLFLKANGDIGTGTNNNNPLSSFDIRANTTNNGGTKAVASISGQTSLASLVVDQSGVGDIFAASKSGSTKFVITNSGNVGIGTSNPSDKLNVNGNIVIEQQATTGVANMQNWTKTTGTAGTIGGNNSSITAITASAVYNGSLYIGTSKSNGAEVYRYDGNNSWTKVTNTTAGTIATGGTPTANIDTVSSMIVYNGILYIGTTESNSAEVYRYEGSTTWTKVTQATAGTIRSGGTASIDGISSMAVHGGKLYIGTSESAAAQIYRYEGGTSWMLQNGTAGTFVTTNTAAVNTITSMVSFQGSLYFTTAKTGDADFVRMNGNGAFLSMNATGTTGSYQVYNTEGTPTGAAVTAFDNAQLSVYAGKIVLGMYKSNAAEVYQWNPNEVTTTTNVFIRLNSAAGTIRTGGTASIDAVSSITTYGGRLYIGTSETGSGQLYRYDGTAGAWTLVSQNTAGMISSGGTAAIDTISTLIPYGNNQLFAGVSDATSLAEGYSYSVSIDQSYALQFHVSNSQAGGEQNNNKNLASIYFVASLSANLNNKQGNTGAFVFSHNIVTNNGSYDVAEDYPTRDDTLEPGDVVSIDTNERGFVKKSEGEYDYTAIGVYSESPAMRLSQDTSSIDGGRAIPVALAGRVPVKVTAENGAIKKGDPLTPSSIPGVAMKAKKSGLIIGQALDDFDSAGVGRVMIYVKSTSYGGSIAESFENIEISSSNAGKEILDQLVSEDKKGLTGSNVVTDRLIASVEIVTPKLTVDSLHAKKIIVDEIEGLTEFEDRIAELENKVATLSASTTFDRNLSVQVEYATISSKLAENELKLEKQNKLMQMISDQLASSSASSTQISTQTNENLSLTDNLRLKGNALIEGVVTVVDSIITNNFIANGLATFFGDTIFKSKADFEGQVTFSNDIGGTAVINKDEDNVKINFEKEFDETPILNASVTFDERKDEEGNVRPLDELRDTYFAQKYEYVIADKSKSGFVIILNKKALEDITFTWTAIRVKDAKNYQSRKPD